MCVAIEEDSGFGGAVWYRFADMAYKEEVEYVLNDSPLLIVSGEVDLAGMKEKHPTVFVEVLRDRISFR